MSLCWISGIIEQHQGTLVASSEGLGCGSTFHVAIPLYRIDGDLGEAVDSQNVSPSAASASVAPLQVLVVDDSLSNRRLLGRLMTNRGHTCEEAENGEVALQMIRESMANGKSFDLVLLDFEMPVLNGPRTAKQLREEGNDVFIVGITGNMMTEDVNYFISCGANSVLPKPLKINALEEICMEYGIGCG